MSGERMTVTVVVPTLNEAANLRNLVERTAVSWFRHRGFRNSIHQDSVIRVTTGDHAPRLTLRAIPADPHLLRRQSSVPSLYRQFPSAQELLMRW